MPPPQLKSKDPKQQRLRDHKRTFNNSYKEFSQRLKAFKDGLNGRGNAKMGLPPSDLKEALPSEIGSYLNQLAGDFQSIVGDAESIIAEQAQYATTRRRKQPKKMPVPGAQKPVETSAVPTPTPGAPPTVEESLSQLGAAEHGLVAEASNRFTRFWQYLTAIFSSKQFNRQRVGLLSQAADLYYSLIDLENKVLSMDMKDIPNTVGMYKNVKYNFDSFVGTFKGLQKMMEDKAEENGVKKPAKEDEDGGEKNKEGPPEESESNAQGEQAQAPSAPVAPSEQTATPILTPELSKIKTDVHLLFNANLAKKQVNELFALIREYQEEDDAGVKSMWEDRIKSNFGQLVKHLVNEAQKKYGPAGSSVRSVQDIINLVHQNKQAEYISEHMEKTAHNALTRALKRRLVKMRTSNKTAPVRLQIDEIIDSMKSTTKTIMNILEKDISMEELVNNIKLLEEDRRKIDRPMHVLNIFYMKDFFAQDKKRKPKNIKDLPPGSSREDELADYVLQRKLRRELSGDLS